MANLVNGCVVLAVDVSGAVLNVEASCIHDCAHIDCTAE